MEIKINPKNKGKFTATKKRTGKSTEELTHSKNPTTKKRAVFAQNAAKWKHEDGGVVSGLGGMLGLIPTPFTQIAGGAMKLIGGILGQNEQQQIADAQHAKMVDGAVANGNMTLNNPYTATMKDGGLVNLNVKGKYSPVVWNGDMYDHMVRNNIINADTLPREKFSKYTKDQVVNLVNSNPDAMRVQPGKSATNPWGLTFMVNNNYKAPMPIVPAPNSNGYSIQRYEADFVPGQETYSNAKKVGNVNSFENRYAAGGIIPGEQPNIEAENNEVMQGPDGSMTTLKGATHDQGGIDVAAQPGSRIYSNKLKASTGKTFAEEADKIKAQLAKYEKMLS